MQSPQPGAHVASEQDDAVREEKALAPTAARLNTSHTSPTACHDFN